MKCEVKKDFILHPLAFILLNGGLAQLVERLLCKQDVSGSSPLTSTCTNCDSQESEYMKLSAKAKKDIVIFVVTVEVW
jgi:hypothetical protein